MKIGSVYSDRSAKRVLMPFLEGKHNGKHLLFNGGVPGLCISEGSARIR